MRYEESDRLTRTKRRFWRNSVAPSDQGAWPRWNGSVALVLIGLSLWSGLVFSAFAQSPERQTACQALRDKQSRADCFERSGTPVVDCDRPQNSGDEAFCREVSGNKGAAANPDPIVQWCTEHTNPATCSDVNSCIAICVQRSGQHDPAAVAAQLKREHEARQRQEQVQAEATEKLKLAQDLGYRSIGFDDFQLDGKEMARTKVKLMMRGFYSKSGDIDVLQPTGIAVAVARNYGTGAGVPLMTDDASREARALFLQCGQNVLAQLGCPMTIVGHADLCTMTNLVGSKNVPCVSVEDGWQ